MGCVVTETLNFEVAKKEISLSSIQFVKNKQYDTTSDVYNSLNSTSLISTDVESVDLPRISISAKYYDNNVEATDVGEYTIKFTLLENGDELQNYHFEGESDGEILQREITIEVNKEYTYSASKITIEPSDLEIVSGSLIGSQTFDGQIVTYVEDAAEYQFSLANVDITNLKINSGSNDVTLNYNISLAGSFVINAKVVKIVNEDIELVYNGEIQTIEGLFNVVDNETEDSIGDLEAVALQVLDISYNKIPKNIGTYIATFEMTTTNFTLTTTSLTFKIKKKDLVVNIGNIIKQYNSKSKYETTFRTGDSSGIIVSGIVPGHTYEGSVYINSVGSFVREYDINQVTFDVTVLDQSGTKVSINYNIIKQGTFEVVPYEVQELVFFFAQKPH